MDYRHDTELVRRLQAIENKIAGHEKDISDIYRMFDQLKVIKPAEPVTVDFGGEVATRLRKRWNYIEGDTTADDVFRELIAVLKELSEENLQCRAKE